jgi:6-pyruvoyltetrahydropterin/6-carboxytetrahydropterin synthase
MAESYHIRLEKERHVFSAAHFITYGDDVCEPLHGHNYRVAVEVEGPLGEHQYVVDFIEVRDAVTAIIAKLDHRMLLPATHPTIRVTVDDGADGEVTARHGARRWVFPRSECVILPIANTTAEMVAGHIAVELRRQLPGNITRLEVAVDECDGQWGVYRWSAS